MIDLLVPIALAGVALPGLLLRRFGPWPARLAALMVLVVLVTAASNPQRREDKRVVAEVVVVPTGEADGPAMEAFAATLGRPPAVVGGDTSLSERIAIAQLQGGSGGGPAHSVLLWTGPFRPPVGDAVVVGDVTALTETPPPSLEPAACEVRALAPLVVGRPGAFELRVRDSILPFRAKVRIFDPSDRPVLTEEIGELVGSGEVAFIPELAGSHRFSVEFLAGASRVTAVGRFEAGEASEVLVVGVAAQAFAAALAVQSMKVATASQLPEELKVAALVLLDPVSVEEQARVVEFVDDGGGLFVVGAEDGGGIAPQTEPLQACLPVVLAARPSPKGGSGTASSGVGAAESTSPPVRQAPLPKPSPPEPGVPPSIPPAEGPAAGDTRSARISEGPEVEVERRTVAMVLVIDRSGSMGEGALAFGLSKMDFAKKSAYETARALEKGDVLGVVTFGITGQEVLPMTSVGEMVKIRRTLEGLQAGARRTLISNAIEKAAGLLVGSRAAARHVVIISDGEIHDASEAFTKSKVKDLHDEHGVTVSLIQISGQRTVEDRHAHELSKLGGGRFVRADRADEIPRLVMVEVRRALGAIGRRPSGEIGPGPLASQPKPDARPDPKPDSKPDSKPNPKPDPKPEPDSKPSPFLAVHAITDSNLLRPEPDGEWPRLAGILPVDARPESRVLLATRSKGIPVLAFINHGLGKVGVWTSDLTGSWGERWRVDPAYPGRIALWLRSLLPPLTAFEQRDLIAQRDLHPLAPTLAERDHLEGLAGGPLRPVSSWREPLPVLREEVTGRAVELSAWVCLALVLLVLVEWLSRWKKGVRSREGSRARV